MLVKRLADLAFLLKRGNAKERQFEDCDRRVLVLMIAGAELRHLKGADRDPVEVSRDSSTSHRRKC